MFDRPVLVVGPTGGFGAGIAQELLRRGHRVRAYARNPVKAHAFLGAPPELEVVHGTVEELASLRRAAKGSGLIVHAVNYPFTEWTPRLEIATANVAVAAAEAGAAVLFPSNVYGLGAQTRAPLDESAKSMPCARKGTLRVYFETTLAEEAGKAGFRLLVLRAGDYFGPTVRNGLIDPIFSRAVAGKPMRALGRLDVPHQWAYVPDLARAAVDLLERIDALAPIDVVHFAGHVPESQQAFLDLVATRAGHPGLGVERTPWWLVGLRGLFDGMARELMEIRYLFDEGVILDGHRLGRLLPDFKTTPLDEAVDATLESYRRARPVAVPA